MHPEETRIQKAREEAEAAGREVLTPRGAVELFDRKAVTVRLAVRNGHIASPFTLHITNTPVRFLALDSAQAYWQKRPDDFEDRLRKMRSQGHTFGLDGEIWAVLHPTELVELNRPGELG